MSWNRIQSVLDIDMKEGLTHLRHPLGPILCWWNWRYIFEGGHLNRRSPKSLKLYGWHNRGAVTADVFIITIDLILRLFIISQKRMRRRAVIFREAHSTFLSCPRLQSRHNEYKEKGADGWAYCTHWCETTFLRISDRRQMIKSTQTVAVVMRRRNGNDPIGCGFGEGRASEFDVSCE